MREKETIYTIPVNDAIHAEGDLCPLCRLAATADAGLLDYYLGPSLMEPDVRQTTNEKGFCQSHLSQMYNSQKNRLGLGLMLHTHLGEQVPAIVKLLQEASQAPRRGLFSGRQNERLGELSAQMAAIASSCVVCDRLAYTMGRYLDVIFWQYFHEDGFAEAFDRCPPICVPHLAMLLEAGARDLNSQERAQFFGRLAERQEKLLAQLGADVEWFTLKFDYRNEDKPWGEARTALARTIRTLEGEVELL